MLANAHVLFSEERAAGTQGAGYLVDYRGYLRPSATVSLELGRPGDMKPSPPYSMTSQ